MAMHLDTSTTRHGDDGHPRCPACGDIQQGRRGARHRCGERHQIPALVDVPALVGDDLYCFKCGYNLRGLTGDPCRCPECGFDNPWRDAQLPAVMITAQLRMMESVPAGCVVLLLSAALLLALCFVTTRSAVPALGLIACTLVVGWINCVTRFRAACRQHPRWRATLAIYHGVAFGLIGVELAWVIGTVWMVQSARSERAVLLCSAVVGAGVWRLARLGHRTAVAEMTTLQRATAVSIAREALHWKMARPPGRFTR